MIAADEIVRISPDVISSTNPEILSGWKTSPDQMLVWRRPDFNVAAVQNYVEEMGRENRRYMDTLHTLRLWLFPDTMRMIPKWECDKEKLWLLELPPILQGFGKIFPHQNAQLLTQDIEQRLSEDAPRVFPGARKLEILIRTQTEKLTEGLHVDQRPVLGFCYGAGTEYLLSNSDAPEGHVSKNFKLSAKRIVANQMGALEPGDVSVMKRKPHRSKTTENLQYRLWIGATIPG